MMIKFRERNPVTIAVVGIAALVGLLYGSFQLAALPIIAGDSYSAMFTEAGGLRAGDTVTMAGTKIGKVTDVGLKGNQVKVTFTAKGVILRDQSTAQIKTETLLGERRLGIVSTGTRKMSPGDAIPSSRTQAPYSLTQGLEDLTRHTGEINVDDAGQALDTLSQAFAQTSGDIGPAMEGITRLSHTVASRDQALWELLQHAQQVTGVLAGTSKQLTSLVQDGNLLLAELNARRNTIQQLLNRTVQLTNEIVGFTGEQRDKLKPALDKLNHTIGILRSNEGNIISAIQRVSTFITGLGEGIASGPFFTGVADVGGLGVFPTAQFIPGLAVPSPFPQQPAPSLPVPPLGQVIGQGVN
ncbi:MCE family protein [Frankia sp. CiP1_Cm_nod2]|uniref:MCE family protein n=1 Tax=Frankia sp. CiP1_Cm_nod2 TaxID=2897161 RepID=UPI002023CF9C